MSHYIKIIISPRVVNHVIGKNLKDEIIRDTLFLKSASQSIIFGPNGLGIYNNKLLTIDFNLSNLSNNFVPDTRRAAVNMGANQVSHPQDGEGLA